MDKKHRKLLSAIAHEAHMMGRIYRGLGEKEKPSEVYDLIESMVEDKLKHHLTTKPTCSCAAVKRIGVGKFCPDCGGRNSRR